MSEKHSIEERIAQIHEDGTALVRMLDRLKQYQAIGIRYVDENDEPCSLGENVVNLFEDQV